MTLCIWGTPWPWISDCLAVSLTGGRLHVGHVLIHRKENKSCFGVLSTQILWELTSFGKKTVPFGKSFNISKFMLFYKSAALHLYINCKVSISLTCVSEPNLPVTRIAQAVVLTGGRKLKPVHNLSTSQLNKLGCNDRVEAIPRISCLA